jgi:small subunit ribosomal protein S6
LITHNDTTEEQQDQLLQAISEIIARHSGSVLKTEKWGKKNFKYVIKKQSKGHYCFLVFESAATALKEIERSIMYNESILRYNFIRLEKFVDTSAETVCSESIAETEDVIETETVETEQAAATQE